MGPTTRPSLNGWLLANPGFIQDLLVGGAFPPLAPCRGRMRRRRVCWGFGGGGWMLAWVHPHRSIALTGRKVDELLAAPGKELNTRGTVLMRRRSLGSLSMIFASFYMHGTRVVRLWRETHWSAMLDIIRKGRGWGWLRPCWKCGRQHYPVSSLPSDVVDESLHKNKKHTTEP